MLHRDQYAALSKRGGKTGAGAQRRTGTHRCACTATGREAGGGGHPSLRPQAGHRYPVRALPASRLTSGQRCGGHCTRSPLRRTSTSPAATVIRQSVRCDVSHAVPACMLLALGANSPFWHGVDTGYACFRQRLLASNPTYGLPPYFDSWEHFNRMLAAGIRSRTIESRSATCTGTFAHTATWARWNCGYSTHRSTRSALRKSQSLRACAGCRRREDSRMPGFGISGPPAALDGARKSFPCLQVRPRRTHHHQSAAGDTEPTDARYRATLRSCEEPLPAIVSAITLYLLTGLERTADYPEWRRAAATPWDLQHHSCKTVTRATSLTPWQHPDSPRASA